MFHQNWALDIHTQVNNHLYSILSWPHVQNTPFHHSLTDALFPGGKRLRPLLVSAVAYGLNSNMTPELLCWPCSAVELLHNYTLVHDDLPCMDNDILRRGLPTIHVKYGESLALLTGTALLNLSFEVLLHPHFVVPDKTRLVMLHSLATANGTEGLLTGQAWDIEQQKSGTSCNTEKRWNTYYLKTGALFQSCIDLAVHLSNTTDHNTIYQLKKFCYSFALAFQIIDDLQDSIYDNEKEHQIEQQEAYRSLKTCKEILLKMTINTQYLEDLLQKLSQEIPRVQSKENYFVF